MTARRHLPVLPNASGGPAGGDPERPPWHWAWIGAVLIFTAWAPLTMLAGWFTARGLHGLVDVTSPDEVARWMESATMTDRVRFWLLVVATPALTFALASAAGGALVGRFGAKTRGLHALAAGAIAAVAAWALSLRGDAFVASLASLSVVLPLGALSGWLGYRLGRPKV